MTPEEADHNLRLLSIRIKLELNAQYGNITPGNQRVGAAKALEILTQCNSKVPDLDRRGKAIIANYILLLNNANKKKNEIDLEIEPSSLFSHNQLLKDLYQYDPIWTEKLTHQFPFAFIHVDEEWCNWTRILK